MIMVEGVPVSVCKYLRENINIPILGIGAGIECEAQALIMHDMLGFYDWVPKFAKKFANLRPQMLDAFNEYHKEVAKVLFQLLSIHTIQKLKALNKLVCYKP